MSVTATQLGVDIHAAYVAHAAHLERLVRGDVRAPDVVIEDACQFAWCRLVDQARAVQREHVLSWLTRTAVREGIRLARREARELPLEQVDTAAETSIPEGSQPENVAEQRSQLRSLGSLPDRQRQILWLRALGLSYAEIAVRSGCTTRTVERQLLRARRSARVAAAE